MFRTSHLQALDAVCESGSFEIAASILRITQSALSQRIGALERETGMVLVERSRPVAPTPSGRIILALAKQVILLSSDAELQLSALTQHAEKASLARISLAINADSVSTWFQPAMAQIANEKTMLLDLHIEDQDHTDALLREGTVMAAVTTSRIPAPGCTVEPLGMMTYWPVCAPSLMHGHAETDIDLSRVPMLRFDSKDDLQHSYLKQISAKGQPPIHYIPSNHEFLMAARLGLGWGVLPEGQIINDIQSGALVRLHPGHKVKVPLYWQRWRLESLTLTKLTDIVQSAAATGLSS